MLIPDVMSIVNIFLDNAKLVIQASTGLFSILIAGLTYRLYREQNRLIQNQTRATEKAREASVQTLEVTTGSSAQDLIVEVSNSGGGAAENIEGVVSFSAEADIDVKPKMFKQAAQRRSTINRRKDSQNEWVASDGNTIAAGEKQVPFEIACATKFEDESIDEPLGFPSAVRHFASSWKKAQLESLQSKLTEPQLKKLGEDWDAPSVSSLSSCSVDEIDGVQISTERLFEIAATTASNESNFDSDDIIDRELRMNIELKYSDEYRKEPEESESSKKLRVLEVVFPMKDDLNLSDVVANDYREERRKVDQKGHILDTSA